jgi:hypothetical protein
LASSFLLRALLKCELFSCFRFFLLCILCLWNRTGPVRLPHEKSNTAVTFEDSRIASTPEFQEEKLSAHFLQTRSKRLDLLLVLYSIRFKFLDFAMLFEEFIEQHCVHGFISHCVRFSFFVC